MADNGDVAAVEEAVKSSAYEEALRRKARLMQLRQRQLNPEQQQQQQSSVILEESGEQEQLPILPVFRNYKPETQTLAEGSLPAPKLTDLESRVREQLKSAEGESLVNEEEADIAAIAPKKPDWDLKRGIERKLNKLERRTQKAIAELLRQRLADQQQLKQGVSSNAGDDTDPDLLAKAVSAAADAAAGGGGGRGSSGF